MDLSTVHVQGFRRFRNRSTLKTNGKVVALVGPNEAGKSTLLQALLHLANDESPDPAEISRGAAASDFLIEGRFLLSQNELDRARLGHASWLIVRKLAAGPRDFDLIPEPPKRDLTLRGRLWQSLNFSIKNKKFIKRLGDRISEIEEEWLETSGLLQGDKEDLSAAEIDAVSSFSQLIEDSTEPSDAATIRNVPLIQKEWLESEGSLNPKSFALNVLKPMVPEIFLFAEDDRELKSEYNIPSLSSEVPSALENLCLIGGLSIQTLLETHARGDTPGLTTLEHAANKQLETDFTSSWGQSGVFVTFRIQGDVLSVQVVNEKSEFTSLAERSDGLRQFVALQAFATTNWSDFPILLVDEAEQKLHYDAQADLVQMLARQDVASMVVITTHSAGCLPEDLGHGVRLVRPQIDDETRSEIVNKFWADNEPGFTPLLFGMGARTLAFFPTRNAVMVEGPSDMLLLPTMFREVLSTDVIGFQFVPGLSISSELFHAPMLGKESGVLFLTDGDEGGLAIKEKLLEKGIDRKNIFMAKTRDGNAIDVEDFIEPGLLFSSVNNLLKRFHGAVSLLQKRDLATRRRMERLELWFEKATNTSLPKVELAYEILEALEGQPGRPILDPRRKVSFAEVAESILARFKALKLNDL